MKNALLTLVSGALLIAATPIESATETAYRYADAHRNGWPKWIGRLSDPDYVLATQKPELAEKYLPLSLIKTGQWNHLVEQVKDTPNIDMTKWPSWIDEVDWLSY